MTQIEIREAQEEDVEGIRRLFVEIYTHGYAYRDFFDKQWLKRSVFSEDVLMLVARDADEVVGTASVVFDVGAHSDLIGEFGRLAVSPAARGRGVGKLLFAERIARVRERLHVAIVENRTAHSYSQRISEAHDFAPIGFLPLKHQLFGRESVVLCARYFAPALELRGNHPRVISEVHALAQVAMDQLGLACDAIADDTAAPYPKAGDFVAEDLTAEGLPSIIRIERGRIARREIFGPVGLQYGFFKLRRRSATYLLARQPSGKQSGPLMGAVGYIYDPVDKGLKIFELLVHDEAAIRFLITHLLDKAREWQVKYVEVDVSAHAPKMQRTLCELGFLPAAYAPALVFHQVERLDVVKMVRLLIEPTIDECDLLPRARVVAEVVMRQFERRSVLPEIEQTVSRIDLFSGLSTEQTIRLAAICRVTEFDPGELLFRAGQPAQQMYLIAEGTAEVRMNGRIVGQLGAGEAAGEVALLTEHPHSSTVVAAGPVRAVVLPQTRLSALCARRPQLSTLIYRNLARGLASKLVRLDASVAGTQSS